MKEKRAKRVKQKREKDCPGYATPLFCPAMENPLCQIRGGVRKEDDSETSSSSEEEMRTEKEKRKRRSRREKQREKHRGETASL